MSGKSLSIKEKIGYSLGDLSANLVFQTLITYLAYFYTDIYGLNADDATAIIFFVGTAAAIGFNPIIGALADRTNSKWGKFRPWILWTAVPLGVTSVLAFTTPDFSYNGKVTYAVVTYTLLLLLYAGSNLPYSALSGVITGDMKERNSISAYRFVAVMFAQFFVQVFMLPIIMYSGGGDKAVGIEITKKRNQTKRTKIKQKDDNMGDIFESMGQASMKFLNLIIKTDVAGTAEAINASLLKIGNDEVSVKIVSSGVGGITESDANLAITTNSSIVGFNVRADKAAKKIIEKEGVDLTYYSIIYELIDDAKAKLSGLLDPIIREEIVGTADVLEVFNSPKFGQVAGCVVVEGTVLRNKPVRVLRDDIVIFQGELDSLRRFKDDVNEVKNGTECGMGIKNYKDIREGDKIEVFDRKEESQSI